MTSQQFGGVQPSLDRSCLPSAGGSQSRKRKRPHPHPDEAPGSDAGDLERTCHNCAEVATNPTEESSSGNPVCPPAKFPFPFPAYDIQDSFMRSLYRTLESGGVGVYESPTGTGKSLSIICGALTWLRDREERRKEELEERIGKKRVDEEEEEDDWIAAAVAKRKEEEERRKAKEELDFLNDKEERIGELRRRRKSICRAEVRKADNTFEELFGDDKEVMDTVKKEIAMEGGDGLDGQDEELLVEEYFSDDEESEDIKRKKGWMAWEEPEEEEEKEDYSIRIFYTSRTHSQLSQFVREIQKSPFADDVRVVSLASRNILCINDQVRKLGSNSLVNERCLELQKKGSSGKKQPQKDDKIRVNKSRKGTGKCPYNKKCSISSLRDQALLQVLDIEEMVSAGRRHKACPYYASRKGVEDAQVVILPYNTLLHKPTREAVGIRLKGSVVIVDEAHNLLDTIAHIHTVQVTGEQLWRAHVQLTAYKERYKSRLKAKNLLYVKQVLFVLANLVALLSDKSVKIGDGPEQMVAGHPRLVETAYLMNEAQIRPPLDIFKLIKYTQKSKIVQKLHGFSCRYDGGKVEKVAPKPRGVNAFLQSLENKANAKVAESKEKQNQEPKSPSSPLLTVVEFLEALTNVSSEARVLIAPSSKLGDSLLKYCLLSPHSKFASLVQECRSVVLAGGTMQPPTEFSDQLLIPCGAAPERIDFFSCGHVIPAENVLPLVVPLGPTGRLLDFSYERRDLDETKEELYRVLSNVCNIVPGGVVCFFPSYEYEKKVYEHLSTRGYISKLEEKKRIFREPKKATEMEPVLRDYSTAARLGRGAVLLSVVGGKMSEGINFSDDLGRCVVMVGLPFPNSKSLELKEKMSHLDRTVGAGAGHAHYENLCMKAVNQSIGRAIRHKGDFATIVLLDQRYRRPGIVKHLPGWIRERVAITDKFASVIVAARGFFRAKTTK